jgi:hypothetical protein
MKPTATQCIVFWTLVRGKSQEFNRTCSSENEKRDSGYRLLSTRSAFFMHTTLGAKVRATTFQEVGPGGLSGFDLFKPSKPKAACLCNAIHNETTDSYPNRQIHPEFHSIQVVFTDPYGIHRLFDLTIVAGPQIGFQAGSRLDLSGTNQRAESQFACSRFSKNHAIHTTVSHKSTGNQSKKTCIPGISIRGSTPHQIELFFANFF